MKVRVIVHLIREGEREPIREMQSEYSGLSVDKAVSLAKTKTAPQKKRPMSERLPITAEEKRIRYKEAKQRWNGKG